MTMIGTGFLIGRNELTGFRFNPEMPYAGCCLCGRVYQPVFAKPNDILTATVINNWRDKHNKAHTEKEHLQLKLSGRRMTPEAAQKLSQFGVIDFGGILVDDEIRHALRVVNAKPTDDAEE